MTLGQGLVNNTKRVIPHLGTYYVNSFPSHGMEAREGNLHNLLDGVASVRRANNGDIDHALRGLKYCINRMSTADKYVKIKRVPAPDGKSCADFKLERFERSPFR